MTQFRLSFTRNGCPDHSRHRINDSAGNYDPGKGFDEMLLCNVLDPRQSEKEQKIYYDTTRPMHE